MAFAVRRPFALASVIKQFPKASQAPFRTFHTSPKPSASLLTKSAFASARNNVFSKQPSFRRFYTNPAIPTETGSLGSRLLYGTAIVGGAVVATNVIFNRETREDGGMPPYEQSYLNDTFMHTGLGVGIIGVAASALHRSGWSVRLMRMNPWLVFGGGLVMSIGSMIGTRATNPDK